MSAASAAITVTTTAGTQRAEKSATTLAWERVSSPATVSAADTIQIDAAKTFQSIDGFGGAFTDAACYTFDKMPVEKRKVLFQQLFSANKLNLNFCRTCIGASDYATEPFSYSEGKADPELERFSIAHDEKYLLPIIKEARAINSQLSIFASPWSPPGWMKSNNSLLGGNMQRRYMPSYAKYFGKFIQAYEKAGVPVDAVTIQNEVDTDQDGKMPACAWPQEYEVDFVTQQLGPLFEREKIKTKIWIIDHNYNLWGRALASLETPDLRKYVSAIAWHGYVGDPGKMTVVHDAYPAIGAHWTEGGPDYTDKNYTRDWAKWSSTFTGILRNWCQSITVWNLALDEVGKPNIGPFPCGGLVTVDSKTGAVTESGQYWALSHFSSFVRRGAKRIDSVGELKAVSHVAFKNPDGQMVLVVTNSGADKQVNLRNGEQSAKVTLAADSVNTFVWR